MNKEDRKNFHQEEMLEAYLYLVLSDAYNT